MPQVEANGISIEVETTGDPADPAVLLIMGLGFQLIHWPDGLVNQLASRGFHVIRFDNRDIGLSTWFDDEPDPNMAAVWLRRSSASRRRPPTRFLTWPTTPPGYSTLSGSRRPTSWVSRWGA